MLRCGAGGVVIAHLGGSPLGVEGDRMLVCLIAGLQVIEWR